MSLAIDAAPLGTQAFSAGFFCSGTAIRTFSDADCSKMYSLSRAVQGVPQIGAMGRQPERTRSATAFASAIPRLVKGKSARPRKRSGMMPST
jgi:hypothetical protein